MASKIALVTGGNRGLGLECCRQLLEHGYRVVVTARNGDEASAAAAELGGEGTRITAHGLDVADSASVAACAAFVRSKLPPIDALVNNAGVSLNGFDGDVARRTIDVNFLGAINVTDALRPALTEHANVVMVSSGLGRLSAVSKKLAARFSQPELTRESLVSLVDEFVRAVENGSYEKEGWPANAYSVSKVAMNALARVMAREMPSCRVNAVSPGWARTRMGGRGAPRSVESGAASIVWAAVLPADGPTGGFFQDGEAIAW